MSHALVACADELAGISVALAVGRALGESVPLLRVSMSAVGKLDERIHEQTKHSRHRATTTGASLPELACRADSIRRHAAPWQRLLDELVRRGAATDVARTAVERVIAIPELDVHSEPAWRFSAREVPFLRALLDDEGVTLEAFVAAGLALDLSSADVLKRCVLRLYETPREGDRLLASAWRTRIAPAELHAGAFAAACEFARATRDPADLVALRDDLQRLAADTTPAERMLALREYALRRGEGADPPADLLAGAKPEPLDEFDRVAIFAGAAAASHALTEEALQTLSWLLGPPAARRRPRVRTEPRALQPARRSRQPAARRGPFPGPARLRRGRAQRRHCKRRRRYHRRCGKRLWHPINRLRPTGLRGPRSLREPAGDRWCRVQRARAADDVDGHPRVRAHTRTGQPRCDTRRTDHARRDPDRARARRNRGLARS